MNKSKNPQGIVRDPEMTDMLVMKTQEVLTQGTHGALVKVDLESPEGRIQEIHQCERS